MEDNWFSRPFKAVNEVERHFHMRGSTRALFRVDVRDIEGGIQLVVNVRNM